MQDVCMAWNGSDCRMFAMSMFAGLTGVQVATSQPAISNTQTETIASTETSTEVENGTQEKQKKTLVAKVIVTEVKETPNGNTRAKCKVDGKEEQIVIAKNGVGKIMQEGQNKKFEIEYNIMKDGITWFAIKAMQLQHKGSCK
ncbi:hypothetical protein SAMN05660649_04779 [Desulfotomaculum arcticum]|uniref:Uncharacterized protein n=1 Tax=Desulfotruncus arcticus DSM 17038 TaxID=1121424 RepID=A0A1I2Z6F4_9FIRM|nr:hypothetical protein SAMN05660649_04779 [Desulfotomaculum arcticum] [Desulfotruncus arcticus DSM 17038]